MDTLANCIYADGKFNEDRKMVNNKHFSCDLTLRPNNMANLTWDSKNGQQQAFFLLFNYGQ